MPLKMKLSYTFLVVCSDIHLRYTMTNVWLWGSYICKLSITLTIDQKSQSKKEVLRPIYCLSSDYTD